MPPEIEVQDRDWRGARSSAPAQFSASVWLAIWVQGITSLWYSAPAHST